MRRAPNIYLWKGRARTVDGISRDTGIDADCIRQRLRRGEPIEKAAGRPSRTIIKKP